MTAIDVTHQVLIPLDGPPRPACDGSGRSVARTGEVTCPECLRLAAERSARTAEPDEFAAADEADAIEVSRAEENRADVAAQADAELHDTHAIQAGDEPVRVLKFTIEIKGRDRDATEFRPLPFDWWQMTPRERGDYLTRMERHLSTSGKEWARFGGIVEAPAEELTLAEVADLYGVTVSTVRRWAANGRLKAKDGSPLAFRRDDLFPHLAAEIPGTGV